MEFGRKYLFLLIPVTFHHSMCSGDVVTIVRGDDSLQESRIPSLRLRPTGSPNHYVANTHPRRPEPSDSIRRLQHIKYT